VDVTPSIENMPRERSDSDCADESRSNGVAIHQWKYLRLAYRKIPKIPNCGIIDLNQIFIIRYLA